MLLIHCVLAATDLNILKFANPKEMFLNQSDPNSWMLSE